jgi:hypothetical protein
VGETESIKHTVSIMEEFLEAVFDHLTFHPKGTNDIHMYSPLPTTFSLSFLYRGSVVSEFTIPVSRSHFLHI